MNYKSRLKPKPRPHHSAVINKIEKQRQYQTCSPLCKWVVLIISILAQAMSNECFHLAANSCRAREIGLRSILKCNRMCVQTVREGIWTESEDTEMNSDNEADRSFLWIRSSFCVLQFVTIYFCDLWPTRWLSQFLAVTISPMIIKQSVEFEQKRIYCVIANADSLTFLAMPTKIH